MKRFLSLVLCVAMLISMVAFANAESTVTLRMATGYNSVKTGITFDPETAGEGITLADGKTYNTGDLKPTWQALEEILGVTFDTLLPVHIQEGKDRQAYRKVASKIPSAFKKHNLQTITGCSPGCHDSGRASSDHQHVYFGPDRNGS